jgi:hypothetical protein
LIDALGRLPSPSLEVVNVFLSIVLKNETEYFRRDEVEALGRLKNLRTDHLTIIFQELMYHPSLQDYLSRYFKEGHLLYIDHKKEQIILSLHHRIHKISFPPGMLMHLEKQIRAVAKQKQYPLDIIYGKEFHVLQQQRKEPHFLVQVVEEDHAIEEKEIEAPARLTMTRGTLFNATSPATAEEAVLLVETEPVDKIQKKPAQIKPRCCVLM